MSLELLKEKIQTLEASLQICKDTLRAREEELRKLREGFFAIRVDSTIENILKYLSRYCDVYYTKSTINPDDVDYTYYIIPYPTTSNTIIVMSVSRLPNVTVTFDVSSSKILPKDAKLLRKEVKVDEFITRTLQFITRKALEASIKVYESTQAGNDGCYWPCY